VNYYQVLGIEKGATPAQIKSAYRAAARKYHPDTNPGDPVAEANFRAAAEAYQVLTNSKKAAAYEAAASHEEFRASWGAYLRNIDPAAVAEEFAGLGRLAMPTAEAAMVAGGSLRCAAEALRQGDLATAGQAATLGLEAAATVADGLEALGKTAIGRAASKGLRSLLGHLGDTAKQPKSTAIAKRRG